MDKWQGLDDFWNSFGIPAYDENSVPDDAIMPYITYHAAVSGFEDPIPSYASIWYRSTSWADISRKADQIAERLQNYVLIPINDREYIHLVKGPSFAQRMNEPGDSLTRRIYINVMMEFFTYT